MKNRKSILLLILLITLGIFLQAQTVNLVSSEISYENKLRPCLAAAVNAEAKPLKQAWAKYLRKNYSVKLKGIGLIMNKDLLTAEDITIAPISANRFNLYSRVFETTTGSEMKVFASFGYDIFMGPDNFPKEFEALSKVTNSFLVEYLSEHYADEISATAKRIKGLGKDKVKLLKEINKNKKEISDKKYEIGVLNVPKAGESGDSIKSMEKINKLNKEVSDLENDNAKALLDIQTIDEKMENRNAKLEKLKSEQTNLIK